MVGQQGFKPCCMLFGSSVGPWGPTVPLLLNPLVSVQAPPRAEPLTGSVA